MQSKHITLITDIALILVGCLLFLPGLGIVHLFDWDEINFAESAREMLVSGNWIDVQVNFETFWEKPPLFIWMQALSMKLFGINEFAARFPNAICGIGTMLLLYHIGKHLKGNRFGLLWVMLYICSFTPFFYFKSGIIDPWFNFFIFGGVYCFVLYTSPDGCKKPYLTTALAGLSLGLAVLTKGPVGFLIFLLTFIVYLAFNRFKLAFKWGHVLTFTVILAVVGCFWFILQIINGHYTIIQDFIIYQIRLFETKDAGHGGFPLYHFIVVLIGVFPASILALPVFHKNILREESDANTAHMFRWMMMLLWVVLILFSIVRTKIVHYSSMCYLPLTFLAAWQTERLLHGKAQLYNWQKVIMICLAVIIGGMVAALPFFDQFKHHIIPLCDEFTAGNLQAQSDFIGIEILTGLILLVCVVLFSIWSRQNISRSLYTLMSGCLIFMWLNMILIVPQVEKYSQASFIEFLEERKGEDCYIYPLHKSYAHYFYSNRQPENNCADASVLMQGDIPKDCYFIARDTEHDRNRMQQEVPEAQLLYKKNGFAFYIRPKTTKQIP